ncbi:hypothetical protein [Tautonia plasticadhaerens]|uniref:Uncharacterized protein n=1 Tax=Tautonia plasticadhaerens TaxID=2527974 RepID=A0A518GYM5_9BACT|nr:hypothetical protein [Tautonia plasticadhaerens]QDV33653.1 hypothetical protein ElP_15290 [Tautonia plasticadhaerens]
MKRIIAIAALLGSLGVLMKVGTKRADVSVRDAEPDEPTAPTPEPAEAARLADEARIRSRYPEHRELVDRVLDRYGRNSLAIEGTDGLRGLRLLDRLDLEALYLYEHASEDFHRLAELVSDEAAADLMLNWREYFGLKRSDSIDRKVLITAISRLNTRQRRAAASYPAALPLILSDPTGLTDLIDRWEADPDRLGEALAVLMCIDLTEGSTDLASSVRTIDAFGNLALDAFRLQGLEGFATVHRFGPVLLALRDAIPLDQALILLRVNEAFVADQLRGRSPEAIAGDLRHVAAANLVPEVGGSPSGLRLVVEHGRVAEEALRRVGPDAATVIYENYPSARDREEAVAAVAEHGPAALAMLAKYADHDGFREILHRYGPDVIPPVASADASPEFLAELRAKQDRSTLENVALAMTAMSGASGQATIELIREDGLDRARSLGSAETAYYEFLPLYDLLHLGSVVTKGYTPTRGEYAWAVIDAGFVIADALSLAALQPQAALASEAARSELKAAARGAIRGIGREASEETAALAGRSAARQAAGGATDAATRAARWWVVRSAGGLFETLRHYPEALARIGLREATDMARPYAAQAGLRLSRWGPMRFLQDGALVVRRIPPEKGLKYLAVEATQAGVGLAAIHKMEEHLSSRRPSPVSSSPAG